MRERTTLGFLFKQISTIYEKEFNRKLRTLGITASQCAVLDYLFTSNEDKRCKNIYLTEKAYDIQRRMETDRKKLDKMLTLGMNKKEVEALKKMLDRVLYNIAEP